ncbi:MAG: type II secretion system protein M [Magnetococcales bacterium]|nr:type II secretion system protein M [Magnetococcales bacterium]
MNEANKRLLLTVSLALLIVLLLIQGVVWIDDTVTQWENKAKAQENMRREVAQLAKQLKASRGATGKERAPVAGKPGEEAIPSLLPWLEKETAAFQLADKMQQIAPITLKPNETASFREKADLTLKAISMETATRFLNRLESNSRIRVIRGDLKRAEKEAPGVSLTLEIGLL